MSGLRTKPTNAAAVSRVLGRTLSRELYWAQDVGDGTVSVLVERGYAPQVSSILTRAWYDFKPAQRGFLVKGKIQG